ncbi:MAG: DNA polymerase I [Synechococcales cyanobacterium]
MQRPKFILVDGHSLAFRSYYAHAKGREGGLRTSTGVPTSVSYGFLKSLLDILEVEKPEYLAIAFDLGTPTFRHIADQSYKEGRPDAPEDFLPDLNHLQEILKAMNLAIVTAETYEADDIIGTLARQGSHQGYQVKILTGDQDAFQLVDAQRGISVLYLTTTFKPNANAVTNEFGPTEVYEKLGVHPHQIVDYKALCGDASDNIPGVRGIGAKTAVSLLAQYSSLHHIYAALPEMKGAVKQKLIDGQEMAFHSQFMATIKQDVPLTVDLPQCRLSGFKPELLIPRLEALEFRSFLSRINHWQERLGGSATSQRPENAVDQPDDDSWFFSADDRKEKGMDSPFHPQIIESLDQLRVLIQILNDCTNSDLPVAWDTETTALDPKDADLVGIGCCYALQQDDEPHVVYIPMGHQEGVNLPKPQVLNALRPILESTIHPKVLQNAKFDRLILRHQGVQLQGVLFDTMLASYLLNPEDSHKLSDLGRTYLGINGQDYGDLVPKGKTIADLSREVVAQYCGMDVYTTFKLVAPLQQRLAHIPKLQALLSQVEVPLEPVLAEMEFMGIRIDRDYLQQFSRQLEQDLFGIEQRAYAAAGETFNLGSPKQLGEVLFETLKLDRRKSRKTKTGYSTDAATLEKLQGDHPVVDLVLEYRMLSKLKSTYVDALPTLIHPSTHRVHTDFNQAVTATGRLSSSHPNLQNIPIRTAFSRQIRKAFLPATGWLLASADYSQIELRILAHLSQEPILLETYHNFGDIHRVTAQLLFEKEDITPEERRLAKTINFGVIYGMGAQRLAQASGVPLRDAKVFMDRFNQRYSNVFAYLRQKQREAIAQGYVETILGRRRYFTFNSDTLKRLRGADPHTIDIENLKLRDPYDAQMLRAAANAPIQGSSADIIKVAMVTLQPLWHHDHAHPLLQVHDELVFEVAPDHWEGLHPKIKNTMETALSLSVPLVVDIHVGQNWMETK